MAKTLTKERRNLRMDLKERTTTAFRRRVKTRRRGGMRGDI